MNYKYEAKNDKKGKVSLRRHECNTIVKHHLKYNSAVFLFRHYFALILLHNVVKYSAYSFLSRDNGPINLMKAKEHIYMTIMFKFLRDISVLQYGCRVVTCFPSRIFLCRSAVLFWLKM